MKAVPVLLPQARIEALDRLVRRGLYPSRAEAIREAVRDLLKSEGFLEESPRPRRERHHRMPNGKLVDTGPRR